MPGVRQGVGLLLAVALVGIPILVAPGSGAAAAGFEPCPIRPVNPEKGEAEIGLSRDTWKRISRSRVTHRLTGPARVIGGRPVYPVRSGSVEGSRTQARLAGGFTLVSPKGRKVRVAITRFVRNGATARIDGRVDGRAMTVFRVDGSTLSVNPATSRVEVAGGRTAMSASFAAIAKQRAGLRQARSGLPWGSLYMTWIDEIVPDVDPPPPPDPFERPVAATDLAGATLTWRVRESWVQYVSSGDDPSALAPALAGPAEEIAPYPPLVYEFTFPFSGGWVDDGQDGVDSASVKGSGGVSFRYCGNSSVFKGINFEVRNPELEVESSLWRLVFEVAGIDGTPFTGSRAVVVEFDPSDVQPVNDPGGITSWQDVPGSIPPGAKGVFGGFYGVGAPFGSISLEIEREG